MNVVGGMPVDSVGRVHTTFTHNPATLRLSSTGPNLQNIPRGSDFAQGKLVKQMFRPGEGVLLWERDFSAIEAVLVGYFAGSKRYVQAAKQGVHAYMTSQLVGKPIDLSWPLEKLVDYYADLKSTYPVVYDTAKRTVHLSNYMGTPRKMHEEYPETFPTVLDAARLQGLYFELFREIPQWHRELCLRVDGSKRRLSNNPLEEGERVDPWSIGVCTVVNPFGYRNRFYNVLDWEKKVEESGEWHWIWSYGDDAKRLVSTLPQGTAAAIIKRAGKRLANEFPVVGQTMRLWVHDSIIGETPEGEWTDLALRVSKTVMEAPIEELPLDPSWNMGEFLTIGTEGKAGPSWADMKRRD